MIEDSNTVLRNIYNEIKKVLSNNNIQVSLFQEIPYGIQFNVSQFTGGGVLRIYLNKKGMIKIDFSQINQDTFRQKIENIINNHQGKLNNTNSDYSKKDFRRSDIEYEPVIGIDESGKGDYFGPLATAAVYVNKKNKILLDDKGVKDSKKLSDKKIFVLNDYIKNVCTNQYTVIEISPEKYNQLYDTFTSEGKKLNTLLAWAHAKSLEEVLLKVDCNKAISDQFADERFIISKLQERGKKITLIQQHKAEIHTAVAAASILARARFLEKLKMLSDEVGINLLKGASSEVVSQAKKIVELKGEEMLKKIAKIHFKTTKSVLD